MEDSGRGLVTLELGQHMAWEALPNPNRGYVCVSIGPRLQYPDSHLRAAKAECLADDDDLGMRSGNA
jgi:hypothetical protein